MRIETSTIRRLRDALMKSGSRDSGVHSPAYETLARAGVLTDEENIAVNRVGPMAETMFLMMTVDGKITESETTAILGAIRGLTDGHLHDGTIKVMLERYGEMVAAQGREARLAAVADQLADRPAEAENAFTLAAAVALADNEVADEERKLIEQLATWFGIKPDRAAAIIAELESEKNR
jgi:tellurite resistance protein